MVNSLTLNKPLLGAISFLNPRPIEAEPNGRRLLLKSNKCLKLTKCPWAVSGLKKPRNPPAYLCFEHEIKFETFG